ncbi:MAG: S41 family peptidase [Planctomycetota bacterium]|nr:S41 family peptidase [Planctomycetota bacterium]
MCRFSKMLLSFVLIFGLILGVAAEEVKLISGISLTPDGSHVLFSWRGDVWSGSVSGGRIERLTAHSASDGYPCVSRDGKWIAFSSNRTGSEQVYRMPLKGGKPTQLTFHSEGTRAVQFAGDDQTLFVSGGRDDWWRWNTRYFSISATKPQSGEILQLDAYGAMAAQSPDNKSILFTREGMTWARKGYQGSKASQIWIKRDGIEGYEKLLGTDQQDCRYPIWAPDGESFYYVSDEDGTRNLWVYRLKSGKRKQITKYDDDGIVAPAISQDGKTIVFRRLFDLYQMDPTKNKMPQLVNLVYEGDLFLDDEVERNLVKADDVAFSRTGKVMGFISGGDIWVMDTVLKEPVRVTDTEAWETDLVFSRDGKTLFYIGQTDGQVDVMSVRRSDDSVPWWRNSKYTFDKITDDDVVEHSLGLSTKGNYLSYVRSREGLWIQALGEEEKDPRKIVSTWSGVSYDWSPDENWITYSASDDDFNYDIFIVNVDDPAQITNVSRHPDNETNPVWSGDGKSIAFVGRRVDQEVDIHYVPLVKELHERTKRDVTLERALKANSELQGADQSPMEDDEDQPVPAKKPPPSSSPSLSLDLDNLHRRIRTFSIPNVSESGLTWSPDSKTLIFNAKIDNKEGIYAVQPYVSSTPRLLLPVKAKIVEWKSTGNRIYWIREGVPGWGGGSGSGGESYSFRARQTYSQSEYQRQVFIEGWRTMRDDFYDGRFNNRNWDAVRRKYEDMAARCKSNENFARVMALMLGELNGSHLGFRGKSDPVPPLSPDDVTAHLGVIFDSTFEGPGWKVLEVLRNSPASKVGSLLKTGDVIISVDGLEIDPGMDESQVMNGKVATDVLLSVERGEMTVSVTIRPTTYASIRSLLYERWLDVNRARVDELSNNRFAYLHIAAMNTSSFQRFERELFEVAAGKEGMVIDVRENGGGFTTDHLLTILTQPRHAITRPRGGGEGYPQDRMVYASWNKPIVVLCNQNSHSNAEIFSHAIKALGRGRVVGVPTSGSVISTGSRSIMDAGSIRVPFRGWYLLGDGQDMELNGAQPHVIIWPQPGAIPAGVDKQLDKAVELLIEDVKNYQSKPSPVLIKASERP